MSDFAPYTDLADQLRPCLGPADAAHDIAHIARVWANARRIQAAEDGQSDILFAATYLHDCVSLEKNDPDRAQASTRAATKASAALAALGWSAAATAAVAHAICAHSYSAGIPPETIEAKTLQDADRLDALGAVGLARMFMVGGRLGRPFYADDDPFALTRKADDSRYTLDHFQTKLLKLAAGFQTATGARLAQDRHNRLERYLNDLADEIGEPRSGGSRPTLPGTRPRD